MKYGEIRHASNSMGKKVFPNKLDDSVKIDIQIIVNRIDGFVAYIYDSMKQIAFRDTDIPELLSDEPLYVAAAFLDNLVSELTFTY